MANIRFANLNFKRTALTDYFDFVGAQTSRNTTTKDANSDGSLSQVYPSSTNQTWDCRNVLYFYYPSNFYWRKISVTFRFYMTANPAVAITIFNYGSGGLNINTSGQLYYQSQTGDTVPLNTWCTIEFIYDNDWQFSGGPSQLFRLNGGTAQQTDFVAGTQNNIGGLYFGNNGSKATGPATTLYFNHIAARYTDDSANRAPWLGALTCEQENRVPIANGFNNDYTGVTQATNKYLNAADNPSDGLTSYNYGPTAWNVTKLQGYTFTANTYADDTKLRGFTVFNILRGGDGQINTADFYNLVRDNSVNYTENISANSVTTTFSPATLGYTGRPADNSALTSTILNNMEGGTQVIFPIAGTSVGQTTLLLMGADGPTYNSQWTPSTGTTKYTLVQDNNDATYITSTTAGFKQSFSSATYSPTPANQVCYGIRYAYKVANVTVTDSNQFRIGVRIGGVDYPEDHTITIGANSSSQSGQQNMTWSGSFNNPATGVPWVQSDYTSAEWYVEHVTKGATNGMQVWELDFYPLTRSQMMNTATFMTVAQGSAFTSNGVVNWGASVSDNIQVSEYTKGAQYGPGSTQTVNVSDSITVSENVAISVISGATNPQINVFDSVTIAESIILSGVFNVNVSDSVTATDGGGLSPGPTAELISNVNVFDSANVSESITAGEVDTVNVFDSINVSESIVTSSTYNANVFDNVTVTENITILLPVLVLSVIDNATVAEAITPSEVLNSSVFDSVNVSESILGTSPLLINTSDSITVSESTTAIIPSGNANVFDSVNVSENIQTEVIYNVNVADNITVSESLSATLTSYINVFDSATIAETITTSPTFNANVSDSIAVSEAITPLIPYGQAQITDNITISESTTAFIPYGQANVFDNITVSENVNTLLISPNGVNVQDQIFVSESVTSWISSQTFTTSDNIQISEAVTAQVPNTFVNVFDNAVVSESVTAAIPDARAQVTDNATVSETTQLELTNNVNVFDSVAVSESTILQTILNVNVFDTIQVSESTVTSPTNYVNVFDSATVSDTITVLIPYLVMSLIDNIIVSETITSSSGPLSLNIFDSIIVSEGTTVSIPSIITKIKQLLYVIPRAMHRHRWR